MIERVGREPNHMDLVITGANSHLTVEDFLGSPIRARIAYIKRLENATLRYNKLHGRLLKEERARFLNRKGLRYEEVKGHPELILKAVLREGGGYLDFSQLADDTIFLLTDSARVLAEEYQVQIDENGTDSIVNLSPKAWQCLKS